MVEGWTLNPEVAGSSPAGYISGSSSGVEQCADNAKVGSSNLPSPTTRPVRLVGQDTRLSILRQGFDPPTGYYFGGNHE